VTPITQAGKLSFWQSLSLPLTSKTKNLLCYTDARKYRSKESRLDEDHLPESFNLATYFLDDRIAEGRGDRVAVYSEDRQYTYADAQRMANQMGNVRLDLGVEMEDRVLIVLPDTIEFVAAWFAIAKVGAVITMVNMILSKCRQAAGYYQRALTETPLN
jgi:non-ribosomal peptide synthetase component E (peptide arylation enzyme)